MAVVEEEIAGDSDAEGYLGCWGYGYLDWFGWYFVVGGPGYLDRGGFGLAGDPSEEFAA